MLVKILLWTFCCPSYFSHWLPPPMGLPGQTVRSDSLQRSLVYPSSLSEAPVYVSSVDINIGYIKLESRAVWVGGIFTADTSEALPSGCKHGQPRIQMDHFPLASLTRNSRRGLLLYSWVQQRCLLWLVWSNCTLVAPCHFWCLKILDLEESWQNLSGG